MVLAPLTFTQPARMAPSTYSPAVEQWRSLATKFFPGEEDKILYLINGESGGNPGAVGDGGLAKNLFQSHYLAEGATPEQAFADARRLYDADKANGGTGYGDWGEGRLYQGKPFGALGANPYNGNAPAATGTTASASTSTPPSVARIQPAYSPAALDASASAGSSTAPLASFDLISPAYEAPKKGSSFLGGIARDLTDTAGGLARSASNVLPDIRPLTDPITKPVVSAFNTGVDALSDAGNFTARVAKETGKDLLNSPFFRINVADQVAATLDDDKSTSPAGVAVSQVGPVEDQQFPLGQSLPARIARNLTNPAQFVGAEASLPAAGLDVLSAVTGPIGESLAPKIGVSPQIGGLVGSGLPYAGSGIRNAIKSNIADEPAEAAAKAGASPGPAPVVSYADLPKSGNVVTGPENMFHGTGQRFEMFDEGGMDATALFGPGIYLTDNASIAEGYAKARGRKGGSPNVASVQVKPGMRLVNLELPLPDDVANYFRQQADLMANGYDADAWDLAVKAIDEGKPGKEVYAAYREGLAEGGTTSVLDAAEALDGVNTGLREMGYNGLAHVGGIRGGKSHLVNILFDPANAAIAENRALTPLSGAAPAPGIGQGVAAGSEGLPPPRAAAAPTIPASVTERLFNLQTPDPGLLRRERILNRLKEAAGVGVKEDELATPIMRERSRAKSVVDSQAARTGAIASKVIRDNFPLDKQGRITNIPGNPTLPDLADRLPEFNDLLTPAQRNALETLRTEVDKFHQARIEQGIDPGTRPSIQEGGFYLPRGRADIEGIDSPIAPTGRGRGKPGSEKPISFSSMAEGIAAGYKYADPAESITAYARDTGHRALDAWAGKQFSGLTSAAGEAIGKPVANQSTRDRGYIDLPGLQGSNFPDSVANAATRWLQEERPLTGAGALPVNAVKAFNNMARMVAATADLSGLGIQGLLGLFSDPIGYGIALRHSLPGLWDDNAFGSFIQHFDDAAKRTAKPTSEQWAASNLRIGGTATELTGGVGLRGAVTNAAGNLPLIKQSNRFFGNFGDALRLTLADHIYAPGKSMDEIAEGANLLTGWSRGRFLGSSGEFVQFAPRFFQSQLELVSKAATDGTLTGAQARQSFAKLIGFGTLITVGANEALGNNKESGFDYLSPIKDGRINPNLLRIRVPGAGDISIFGPWDSLARVFGATAQGDFDYAVRTKLGGAPFVSHAIDLFKGETLTGKPTLGFSEPVTAERVENFIRSFGPFGLGDIGQEPIATTAVAVTGLKASPLTPTEQLGQKVVEAVRAGSLPSTWLDKNGNPQPVTSYQDLRNADPDAAADFRRASPDLAKAIDEATSDATKKARELNEQLRNRQLERDKLFSQDPAKWRADSKADSDAIRNQIEGLYLNGGEYNREDRSLLDIAQRKFHEAIQASIDPVSNKPNWDKVYREVGTYSPKEQELLFKSSLAGETDLRKQYIRDVGQLGEYFDQRDASWKQISSNSKTLGQYATFDDFRQSIEDKIYAKIGSHAIAAAEANKAVADLGDFVSGKATVYLLRNRNLVPILDKYGFYIPSALRPLTVNRSRAALATLESP